MARYTKETEKNFILTLAILFTGLTIFVTKDILSIIIFSGILSYFLFPLHQYFMQHFNRTKICAFLTLTTATIGLFLPLSFMFFFLILSALKLVVQYQEYIRNPDMLNTTFSSFLEELTNSPILTNLDYSQIITNVVTFVVNYAQDFFSSIPQLVFNFFITLFLTYYLLVHNKTIFKTINDYLPLSLRKQNEITRNIQKNIKVLFKGYFLTGVIQTLVALIGYIIFDVPNLLLITFITLLVSLIPYLGTPLIWVPLSFYLFIIGDPVNGVGLLIYGVLIISMIDNFVRPILMSNKETIAPPLVFIGFIGGMFAFGLEGLILGPIIISITAILMKYLSEYYLKTT